MLEHLKDRLSQVSSFHFTAKSGPQSKMYWNGHAEGSVEIGEGASSVTFIESGIFHPRENTETFNQRNVYRWEFLDDGVLVYQERRDIPVLLVKLVYKDSQWQSEAAHHCGDDFYTLTVGLRDDSVNAVWTVTGPKKDERLEYYYR